MKLPELVFVVVMETEFIGLKNDRRFQSIRQLMICVYSNVNVLEISRCTITACVNKNLRQGQIRLCNNVRGYRYRI